MRIDFVALRKRAGMSQRELADMLQVRPSFLSAIEKGRSRMPEEKLARIKEIFELDSFEDYVIDECNENAVPPHTHTMDQNESISLLLNHFHDLAHQRDKFGDHHEKEKEERIDFLTKRNDRLSDKVDELRDKVDTLRDENFRLKELLMKNGIDF